MNLEGRVIGNRYEIINRIGNGGMATVYKAKDLTLNRFVAVKVLREEYRSSICSIFSTSKHCINI